MATNFRDPERLVAIQFRAIDLRFLHYSLAALMIDTEDSKRTLEVIGGSKNDAARIALWIIENLHRSQEI